MTWREQITSRFPSRYGCLSACPPSALDYPGGSEVWKERIQFPTCSAVTPQRASQSAFLLTSLRRDLASQSLRCSTIPLSLLPALMMSHTIWFSAVSSRKRDLVSAEEKERKGGGPKRGAGQTQKTKGSLFPLCALWLEGREGEERGEWGGERWNGCTVWGKWGETGEHASDSHVLPRRRLGLAYTQTHICSHLNAHWSKVM